MPVKRTLAALAAFMLFAAVPAAASNDPGFSNQWGMGKVQAEQAWGTGTGAGVVIAIVDTGVDLQHEDLKDKLVPGINCIGGCKEGSSGQDGEGHGTHVAGIAAAATFNGRGVAGTAPGAKIMPVRVLNKDGEGSDADVSQGIRWAADHGASVINLSLSGQDQAFFGPGSTFGSALAYAWGKGAIPVVTAGNQFLLSSGYDEHNAIVVTATDRNDNKPDFASVVGDAKWGMAAPGGANHVDPFNPTGAVRAGPNDIFSTYWDSDEPGSHNLYAYSAGTSMSAPFISGAAAILRGLGLSPQATVDRLISTTDDVGPPGQDETFGYGRLNLARAVQGLGPSGTSGGTGSGTSPGKKRVISANAPPPAASLPPTSTAAAPDAPTATVLADQVGNEDDPRALGSDRQNEMRLWPLLAFLLLAGSSTGLFVHMRARTGG